MITSPAYSGAAFGTARDGDLFNDELARRRVAHELQVPADWAWARQVHGDQALEASAPGVVGEGDILFTTRPHLPVAVRTADCVPVAIHAEGAVAIVHAGWRGLRAGAIERARQSLESAGHPPHRAALGPAIGPCCYEVGEEVLESFPGSASFTTWGSPSLDLWSEAARRLEPLPVWRADLCTHCEGQFHSYRLDSTDLRQTSVAWQ
nr:polyphenol oxidase family protein [Desulfuromonadales bacterium]